MSIPTSSDFGAISDDIWIRHMLPFTPDGASTVSQVSTSLLASNTEFFRMNANEIHEDAITRNSSLYQFIRDLMAGPMVNTHANYLRINTLIVERIRMLGIADCPMRILLSSEIQRFSQTIQTI